MLRWSNFLLLRNDKYLVYNVVYSMLKLLEYEIYVQLKNNVVNFCSSCDKYKYFLRSSQLFIVILSEFWYGQIQTLVRWNILPNSGNKCFTANNLLKVYSIFTLHLYRVFTYGRIYIAFSTVSFTRPNNQIIIILITSFKANRAAVGIYLFIYRTAFY